MEYSRISCPYQPIKSQSMKLVAKEQIDLEELKGNLERAFTDYKVKYPLFSKKMLRVSKGLSWVGVFQKKDVVKISGGPNIGNIWLILAIAIGAVLGVIGALLVVGIVWFAKKKEFTRMEQEVGHYIKEKYALQDSAIAKA